MGYHVPGTRGCCLASPGGRAAARGGPPRGPAGSPGRVRPGCRRGGTSVLRGGRHGAGVSPRGHPECHSVTVTPRCLSPLSHPTATPRCLSVTVTPALAQPHCHSVTVTAHCHTRTARCQCHCHTPLSQCHRPSVTVPPRCPSRCRSPVCEEEEEEEEWRSASCQLGRGAAGAKPPLLFRESCGERGEGRGVQRGTPDPGGCLGTPGGHREWARRALAAPVPHARGLSGLGHGSTSIPGSPARPDARREPGTARHPCETPGARPHPAEGPPGRPRSPRERSGVPGTFGSPRDFLGMWRRQLRIVPPGSAGSANPGGSRREED